MKYDKQKCPKCSKPVKTLYRPSINHKGPNLCYWCNRKRVKKENEMALQK
ncbi:TPA: hypothetical protein QCR57_006024 [Bacillus cereus]|nr:hypothetical protein [Bacillus cereus]HDR4766744.1 hypothetical protein [Bacillus cereus]HDR4799720.1 hypothetical protein [Bacillus cereus]HDR4805800.1 hypothetical protein [Bacillus cereus]HDR4811757.1 hypothetical protein [Bacillus cereus]HDR4834212.1 hypothetical protein [Bacillus cereus]